MKVLNEFVQSARILHLSDTVVEQTLEIRKSAKGRF